MTGDAILMYNTTDSCFIFAYVEIWGTCEVLRALKRLELLTFGLCKIFFNSSFFTSCAMRQCMTALCIQHLRGPRYNWKFLNYLKVWSNSLKSLTGVRWPCYTKTQLELLNIKKPWSKSLENKALQSSLSSTFLLSGTCYYYWELSTFSLHLVLLILYRPISMLLVAFCKAMKQVAQERFTCYFTSKKRKLSVH